MKQLVAVIMIAFLVPTAAMAKNACKDKKAKFCKDAKAAGKKANDCLKEHSAELSPACKEQLEDREGREEGREKERREKERREQAHQGEAG